MVTSAAPQLPKRPYKRNRWCDGYAGACSDSTEVLYLVIMVSEQAPHCHPARSLTGRQQFHSRLRSTLVEELCRPFSLAGEFKELQFKFR